jgi:hypothetical protein
MPLAAAGRHLWIVLSVPLDRPFGRIEVDVFRREHVLAKPKPVRSADAACANAGLLCTTRADLLALNPWRLGLQRWWERQND